MSTRNNSTDFDVLMKRVTKTCQKVHSQATTHRNDRLTRAQHRFLQEITRARHTPSRTNTDNAWIALQQWKRIQRETETFKKNQAFDRHILEEERATRRFLSNRRPRRKSQPIPGVRDGHERPSTDAGTIESTHTEYWKQIFSHDGGGSERPPTQDEMKAVLSNLPALPPQAKDHLEKHLTTREIEDYIRRMPTHKAAGADGIRAELLKQDAERWATILSNIYEKCLHTDQDLPSSFTEAIMILLYKKGCPLTPGNYRPIALINAVAKVMTGVMNNRLRQHLSSVIPATQTGFIPNRSITENIIYLQDAMHHAKSHCPSAVIVCLDFAKAYDRVQWPFLFATLEAMNFGTRFTQAIRQIYKKRSARLLINGKVTTPFQVTRGTQQGDPISPSLFVLQTVPLCMATQKLDLTHGIPLHAAKAAPSAVFYADDTNIVARSAHHAVEVYNAALAYCKASGAKLNKEKCFAIAATHSNNTLPNGIRILPPHQAEQILGVPMGTEITRSQQIRGAISKMIERAKAWLHLGRTTQGRITIARSMIMSTLWHVLSVISTDNAEAQTIQNVISNYINKEQDIMWAGNTKRGNLPSRVWYTAKTKGGWGLAPILRQIKTRKLAILRTFFNEHNKGLSKPWHLFMIEAVRKAQTGFTQRWQDITLWHHSQHRSPPDQTHTNWDQLSPWWRSVWSLWLNTRWKPRPNSAHINDIRNWPIWKNRILARAHGLKGTLAQQPNNRPSRDRYHTIRMAGLTTFKDFHNGSRLMTGQELKWRIQRIRQTSTTTNNRMTTPLHLRTCNTIMKQINTLWTHAVTKWADTTSNARHRTESDPITMEWIGPLNTNFQKSSNSQIGLLLETTERKQQPTPTIYVGATKLQINWKEEDVRTRHVAPTRRDILQRLVRNGLPLGIKRIHWNVDTRTTCPNCTNNHIETANHLFHKCAYATYIWAQISDGWRGPDGGEIRWIDILRGSNMSHKNITHNDKDSAKIIDQLWAITRACVIRVIWLERNMRTFNPTSSGTEWRKRQHQALSDITAHVASMIRRSNTTDKQKIRNIANALFN